MYSITFYDACAPEDEALLSAKLYQFNAKATGADDGRVLAAVVRDDANAVIAGAVGWTWGSSAALDVLWVREDHRGKGIGRSLLSGAEAEARRRGARTLAVNTYSFQAPGLYCAAGYEIVGEIHDSPFAPHRQLFLRKQL